jgi:predicted metal-binding transcription factor (methanogenesis marker protein 9)
LVSIDQDKLRNLQGWKKNAPVPVCMGGDYRALTFCCKPGYSLTFGFKCKRDDTLRELNLSPEEFVKIKEKFSEENDWHSEIVCFGSISYCCMRRGGCPKRDTALRIRYPTKSDEEIMETYFKKKKELSQRILKSVENPEVKERIKDYINLF